jgi:hypothetical protein
MPLQPNTFSIDGTFWMNAIHEAGDSPENIIKTTDPYHIHVHLELTGDLMTLANDKVRFEAKLESMGSGFEGNVGETTVTFPDPITSPHHIHVTIPCGSPDSDGVGEGVYKLMVLATTSTAGGSPLGIVGYGEGPFVQVYEA